MSSVAVRNQIIQFLEDEFPLENVIDLSGESDLLKQIIGNAGLTMNDPWLGVQFVGDIEEAISLHISNDQGTWAEYGAIYIHAVGPAVMGGGKALVQRAEAIKNKIRSRRFGTQLAIESVTPPNTEAGAGLVFESGYMSATIVASYRYETTNN